MIHKTDKIINENTRKIWLNILLLYKLYKYTHSTLKITIFDMKTNKINKTHNQNCLKFILASP